MIRRFLVGALAASIAVLPGLTSTAPAGALDSTGVVVRWAQQPGILQWWGPTLGPGDSPDDFGFYLNGVPITDRVVKTIVGGPTSVWGSYECKPADVGQPMVGTITYKGSEIFRTDHGFREGDCPPIPAFMTSSNDQYDISLNVMRPVAIDIRVDGKTVESVVLPGGGDYSGRLCSQVGPGNHELVVFAEGRQVPTSTNPILTIGCGEEETSPPASVKAKAVSRANKLYVNVNPNKGSGYWRFQVQKQNPDGTWKALKTYRTKGAGETRTINLPKGTYQVVVRAKYGYSETTAGPVTLKK